jgi:chromosome segregation ATPase
MADAKSPEERLEELKRQLQQHDDRLGSLTKERDALKTDVEALSKSVDEIGKASAAYGKGVAALGEEWKGASAYHKTKAQMVEAALGEEKKKTADERIAAFAKKLADKRTRVGEAEAAAAAAAGEYEKARKAFEEKQRAYDETKDRLKSLGNNLQAIKGYRAQIEKYDDQGKPAHMYVIVLELKKTLDRTQVKSREDFEKELKQAWQELEAAREEARQKRQKAEASKATLAREQAELKWLEENRVGELLKEVGGLD